MKLAFAIITAFMLLPFSIAAMESAEPEKEIKTPTGDDTNKVPTPVTTGTQEATGPMSEQNNEMEPTVSDSQPKGSVQRGIFTTGISDREPIDNLNEVANDRHKVYFFSELVGMTNQTVLHRWLYKDTVKAELKFNIKGNRWRIYSSKNLMPGWTGTWTVQVTTEDGTVVDSHQFDYIEKTADKADKTLSQ